MKIYIDLVLFLNFMFDFLLLLTTSITLKRRASLKRITLGSIIGSITILVLFVPLNVLTLFIFKIILFIIIILATFGFKDIKYTVNNLVYFYLISITLGGFMYYLNTSFSYKNIGMVFFNKGLSINYIFIFFTSPIILYIYNKQMKHIKEINKLHYKVDIYINNNIIKMNAYLDTGNTLTDPYKKRPVIITNSKNFIKEVKDKPFFYIPYESINNAGLIKCYLIKKIYIENKGIKSNVVIGVINEKLKVNGVNLLLNNLLMEDL